MVKPSPNACWLVVAIAALGCGGEQKAPVIASAPQASVPVTEQTVVTPANVPPPSGVGEVQFTDGPIKSSGCYCEFTPPAGGRSGTLALRSQRATAAESFPSLYIQASVAAADLKSLAGQTLPAQMFFQSAADLPTWHSTADQPVQLKVIAVAPNEVTLEVAGGTLVRADGKSQPAAGKFTAILP